MAIPDYEGEYNNGRRVPEVDAISARWVAASAAYHETADAELDRRYGPGDRNRYDLFFTAIEPGRIRRWFRSRRA